jgi:hypothetical protein
MSLFGNDHFGSVPWEHALAYGARGLPIALQAIELSDDVRCDLIFDEGDAITQLQFPLFQPLQAQQIRRGRLMQCIDRRVEIAVLLLQPCEFGFKFALIFIGHGAR